MSLLGLILSAIDHYQKYCSKRIIRYNHTRIDHVELMKKNFQEFFLAFLISNLFLLCITSGMAFAAPIPEAPPPPQLIPGQVVIGLAEGTSLSDLNLQPHIVPDFSDSAELAEINVVILDVTPGKEIETANALQQQANVMFAEPNYLLYADFVPNDTHWGDQYAPASVGAPDAWDVTTGNSAVVLAIMDSGIDISHPEFTGRLLTGYDFVDNDNIPQDGDGHGTHVAGIAAATGNNGRGIAGIDWQARILPIRILNNFGSGSTVNFAKGILYAIENKADVINLSLGTSVNSSLLEYSTYYAYQSGIALVASAGNFNGPVSYPAAYPWVLAVGATNSLDQRWASSNYGAQLDLVAPGVDIYSTGLAGSYFYETGTSMSAPLVSGTAALLAGRSGFSTPNRIYTAITNTASQYPARDDYLGYGLLQVDAALAFDPSDILPPAPPVSVVEYDAIRSSRCENIQLQWRDLPPSESVYSPIPGIGRIDFEGNYANISFPPDFEFTYAGIVYTQLTINEDGWIGFDGPYTTLFNEIEGRNDPIPTKDADAPYDRPDWLVAPFWDDLSLEASGGVYAAILGDAPNREFVIEYREVPLASNPTGSSLTFQVVLQESSGEIIFNYLDLAGSGSDGSFSTIGLEFNNGQSGIQIGYNQANTVRSGESIVFVPFDPTASSRSTKGCLYSVKSGPTGGLYDFDPFCLDVPSGLLAENSTITLELLSTVDAEKSAKDLGQYAQINIEPDPLSPYNPMPMLCYKYSTSDLVRSGSKPSNLYLARFSNEGWIKLDSVAQTETDRILSPIVTEGIYGVFAIPAPENLPVTGGKNQTTNLILLIPIIIFYLGNVEWQRRR